MLSKLLRGVPQYNNQLKFEVYTNITTHMLLCYNLFKKLSTIQLNTALGIISTLQLILEQCSSRHRTYANYVSSFTIMRMQSSFFELNIRI